MVGKPEIESAKKSHGANHKKDATKTIFSEIAPDGPAHAVSEVARLLSQSPAYKHSFISDLEWMVMPPVIMEQYRTFYEKDRLVGVALWAKVDARVEQRLAAGNARMQPADWRSGARLWIVNIAAPTGKLDEMLKDIKANEFQNESFKYLSYENGKAVVEEM